MILTSLASGIIPLLVGTTLFVWLKELHVDIKTIGLYSLSFSPFIISFIFSIALDYLSHYKFIKYKYIVLGCLSLTTILITLIPSYINQHILLFIICTSINFFMAIAAPIIFSLEKTLFNDDELTTAVSINTVAFKVGIIISGSLALYASSFFSWQSIYLCIAGFLVLPIVCILMFNADRFNIKKDYTDTGFIQRITTPFYNLLKIPNITLIVLLMLFYRAPDNMITSYLELIYLKLGMSKLMVAFGYKFYGLVASSVGGILCIYIIRKYQWIKSMQILLLFHLISYIAIYCYISLKLPAYIFILCVTLEELTRGLTMVAFWSYQTYVCSKQDILIHIAFLTGIASLSNTLFGSVSGIIITYSGYANFFLIVCIAYIPAVFVLNKLQKS